MLNNEVKDYIGRSVLCWLATCNRNCEPNVSPKEVFTYLDDHTVLIANICSPNSVENIRHNPSVCVSFVDVFVQKGFKLKGDARIVSPGDPLFEGLAGKLTKDFNLPFPIRDIIIVTVTGVARIIAPGYHLRTGVTEPEQIASALDAYNVRNYLQRQDGVNLNSCPE